MKFTVKQYLSMPLDELRKHTFITEEDNKQFYILMLDLFLKDALLTDKQCSIAELRAAKQEALGFFFASADATAAYRDEKILEFAGIPDPTKFVLNVRELINSGTTVKDLAKIRKSYDRK